MRITLTALAFALACAAAAHADDSILVLDASGSMWGQIDGKSKVEIARAVVGDLLGKIPAERRIGLVAYGHRREGDCADIEEVVAVGSDREAIRRAVGSLGFKGKTPLSAAVVFAAEHLKYKDTKATVILVSDGVETCGLDPCVVGRELEAAGVDFVAHVIGFGLANATESAGLRCLAEATGGRYFAAQNASELTAALSETIAAAPVPAPAPSALARVVLRATDLDGGPEITTGLDWTIAPAGGTPVFSQSSAGVVETEIAAGSYVVNVVQSAGGLKGEAKLDAHAGAQRTVTIPLERKLEATVTVTPQLEAPAGSEVSVAWTGPNRKGDYVTVVKKGAAANEYLDYKNTDSGNPLALTLPGEPGDYEVRYMLGAPQRVLASAPLAARTIEATVTVPSSAPAGSNVEVTWTGPGYDGDWVTVVKPDTPVSAYLDYFDADTADRTLEMPADAGDYEVRYVLGGKRVLARAPIAVTDVSAVLEAPASVMAGEKFGVTWTGPNSRGDWMTIVKPDAADSAYLSYANTDTTTPPAVLSAPTEPGTYELRYVFKGKRVIARRAVEVTGP